MTIWWARSNYSKVCNQCTVSTACTINFCLSFHPVQSLFRRALPLILLIQTSVSSYIGVLLIQECFDGKSISHPHGWAMGCHCWLFWIWSTVSWVYSLRPSDAYRKISNIRRTKSPHLNVSRLVLQSSLPNPMKPGVKHVLSREWRCSWSSADRRCSNYIWVVDNFIAY